LPASVAGRAIGAAAEGSVAAAQSVVLGTMQFFLGSLPFSSSPALEHQALPAPVSASVPAVAAAMVEAAVGQGRGVVDVGEVVVAGVQTASVLPRTYFYFPRIDAAALNDAMATFIADSIAKPQPPAVTSRRPIRAWVVTGVVMAADAALLFSWHRSRAKTLSKRRPPQHRRRLPEPQA